MTICEHLVAHTRGGVRSLLRAPHARWLWERLRAHLPSAIACVIIPDHVHVVAPVGAKPVLVRVLAAFTTAFRVRFDVLDPQPAHSVEIAHRMTRYVLLNPVRERLVDDPWCWGWSTLRDLAGAAHPIWTPADRIAVALELPPADLLRALTCTADARPLPPAPMPVLVASIAAIRHAVCAALRIADEDLVEHSLARALVVQTAHCIGPLDAASLAHELACSRRTIFRDRGARHPALDAVLLCLSDARLHGTPSVSTRSAAR